MKNFFGEIAALLETGEAVAVATIARGSGSAPRSGGTRCGIRVDGSVVGTIGGGLLEAKTQETGREALADQRVHLLELRLDNRDLAAAGMVCGGSVDIVVVPWSQQQLPLARAAAEALDNGAAAALALAWSADGATWSLDLFKGETWLHGGIEAEQLPDLLREAQDKRQPVMVGDSGSGLVLDLLLRQRAPLVILGGGHVGRALARAASMADFSVTVVDDRPEFATPGTIPGAHRVVCRPVDGTMEEVRPDSGTFVVICTRGHLSDTECAEQALRSPAPYVGVIGSRRKRAMLLDHLRDQGIDDQRLQALRMPVGIPIGAETPEEIAVSVVAEMIQLRRSGELP